jgi:hypothetical protein
MGHQLLRKLMFAGKRIYIYIYIYWHYGWNLLHPKYEYYNQIIEYILLNIALCCGSYYEYILLVLWLKFVASKIWIW